MESLAVFLGVWALAEGLSVFVGSDFLSAECAVVFSVVFENCIHVVSPYFLLIRREFFCAFCLLRRFLNALVWFDVWLEPPCDFLATIDWSWL